MLLGPVRIRGARLFLTAVACLESHGCCGLSLRSACCKYVEHLATSVETAYWCDGVTYITPCCTVLSCSTQLSNQSQRQAITARSCFHV